MAKVSLYKLISKNVLNKILKIIYILKSLKSQFQAYFVLKLLILLNFISLKMVIPILTIELHFLLKLLHVMQIFTIIVKRRPLLKNF